MIRALVQLKFATLGLLAATACAIADPRLLLSPDDVALIRAELDPASSFGRSVAETRAKVDAYFESTPDVPVPKDPGGGYTHEKHKQNGIAIHDAGILYQLTGDAKYAGYARDLLLAYAKLYPTLGRHPVKRSSTPGRLFWQSLNESVWLVYAIQGYDAIADALTPKQRSTIERGLLRPMADFLSVQSPETFDRIHNHGTWAVAAVGMTGYVLNDREYVQKALYGLKRDGKAGFIKQLDELFSPDGYYTEGPYYQRYALMPFIVFARAIHANDPDLQIFDYRDRILLKAIYACVDLSYAGLLFPVNDAIKDKGLDTIELRYGIATAYALTSDPTLLSIAQIQHPYVLTGDGYRLAKAVDAGLSKPYRYRSKVFRDGPTGEQGALVVLRNGEQPNQQALVFKATAQGMGHGHFDKLTWLFYDNGQEIVADYGAARFLNVEQKEGGHYLPENESWAKQTIAHNTLVVDERSHFGGDLKVAEQHYPELLVFESRDDIQITGAVMRDAYSGVEFRRTMALLNGIVPDHPIVVDVLNVDSKTVHQYDLPLHFAGQFISASPALDARTESLEPLGTADGYRHLWVRASASVDENKSFSLTWLNKNRFYTYTALGQDGFEVLLTQLGANDPSFNLRHDQALVLRVKEARGQTFLSVLEPHGEYNGAAEYTIGSRSNIAELRRFRAEGADIIRITTTGGARHYLALSYDPRADVTHKAAADGRDFEWRGYYAVFDRSGDKR